MKNNWSTKRLEEVCEVFADGDWIEKKDQSTNGIRLIQTGNIGNGYFLDRSEKARYISEDTFKRLRCAEVLPGDCLLSRLPDPVGRSALIPVTGQKMITAVDCTIMRFKKDTLPKWFIYYSLSPDYQSEINKEVTGATRQRISRSNLGNVKIPAPSISEQKQLIHILDDVFEKTAKAKENAEKNLQNAQELFESYLQSAFINPGSDWKEEKMVDVCSILTCGVASTPQYVDKTMGIPFLSAQNVRNGEVVLDKYSYISKEFHEKLTKKNKPRRGDILYSRVGAKFGDAGVVEHDFDFSVYVSLTLIRPLAEKIDNYFLKYYLNSPFVKSLAKKTISSSGVPNLNVNDVREFPVKYPSLVKQKKIVNQIEILLVETKKLESIYQQKLADLEELKKSVLQKAFNGELVGAQS